MVREKSVMHIGTHSRFCSFDNMYSVHWADDMDSGIYNKQGKRFRTRKAATKFKNSLVKKFKKQGYKINYTYLAD